MSAALTNERGTRGRTITYNGVSLQYTTMNIESRIQVVARQDLVQEYLITIQGFEPVGSRNPDSPNNVSELRARLLTPHKELHVSDLSGTTFSAWLNVVPLTRENVSLVKATKNEDTLANRHAYVDVQGGPYPMGFRLVKFFGNSFAYEYVIRVAVSGRDAVELFNGEAPVLGLEASVDYGIDENHYTTRRITGNIFLARILGDDIWKADGFRGSHNTGPDSALLRRLLVGATAGPALGFITKSYTIPKGFRRVNQQWSFDPTLTRVTFEIVDQEVYRTLPWGATSGDADYGVKYDGTTWEAPLKTALSGVFEAPKDVPAEDLMRRIIDLGKIVMGAGTKFGRYSTGFEYRRGLYRNYIEFQFSGLVNFGELSRARTGSPAAAQALAAFGFGIPFNQPIDNLGNKGRAYPPPLFGTGALKGDAYHASFASRAEAGERSALSTLGTANPAYGITDFFEKADLPSEDVNERTVALSPGQIIFYHGENNLVVLARDFTATGSNQPVKAEISGGVQSMMFAGIKNDLAQVRISGSTFLNPPSIYPADILRKLDTYGVFRDVKTSAREVIVPSPIGFLNFDTVTERIGFWRLVLNNVTQEAIQRNNKDYSLFRSKLAAALAKTRFSQLPDLINKMTKGQL